LVLGPWSLVVGKPAKESALSASQPFIHVDERPTAKDQRRSINDSILLAIAASKTLYLHH